MQKIKILLFLFLIYGNTQRTTLYSKFRLNYQHFDFILAMLDFLSKCKKTLNVLKMSYDYFLNVYISTFSHYFYLRHSNVLSQGFLFVRYNLFGRIYNRDGWVCMTLSALPNSLAYSGHHTMYLLYALCSLSILSTHTRSHILLTLKPTLLISFSPAVIRWPYLILPLPLRPSSSSPPGAFAAPGKPDTSPPLPGGAEEKSI